MGGSYLEDWSYNSSEESIGINIQGYSTMQQTSTRGSQRIWTDSQEFCEALKIKTFSSNNGSDL